MTKTQIEIAFDQYQSLLHKLSHQCANRCGRPEEDAFGHASWLFMRAITDYDHKKGKLGTYLYARIRNGLVDWGRKMDLPPDPENILEPTTTQTPEKQLMFKEWFANLSEECREVAAIILNGPAEILEFGNGNLKKIPASSIVKYLLSLGWSWTKARKTLHDLKAAVTSL